MFNSVRRTMTRLKERATFGGRKTPNTISPFIFRLPCDWESAGMIAAGRSYNFAGEMSIIHAITDNLDFEVSKFWPYTGKIALIAKT